MIPDTFCASSRATCGPRFLLLRFQTHGPTGVLSHRSADKRASLVAVVNPSGAVAQYWYDAARSHRNAKGAPSGAARSRDPAPTPPRLRRAWGRVGEFRRGSDRRV